MNTARKRNSARQESLGVILHHAEQIFAESGFRGATMQAIADASSLPKANLHYYFPTKLALYREVIQRIFTIWLEAADSFDTSASPREALSSYIRKKMEISRTHPCGSKVWANEVIQGAPIIQDYLQTTLRAWTDSRIEVINRWISDGKIDPVDPRHLLYMLWATTQHYADFQHQVVTLNGGKRLDDTQWEVATMNVTNIILKGIGA
ncbi:MAG: TetR family transcriptional regulator C-terminal domain-containing protein [Rhodobacteraceae bacterium]|nr:TetR family transcriptional regulator C-terminal domain-containing protein [Paracoccaceae bacterium]